MTTENTLTYRRKAVKSRDMYNGVLYLHRWSTGYQELVFTSHDTAKRWAEGETKAGRPTEVAS